LSGVLFWHSAKKPLPSVFLHSAKKLLCREPFIGRSAKPSLLSAEALPSVFYLALGKAFFAERSKKNARQSLQRLAKKRIPVVIACIIIREKLQGEHRIPHTSIGCFQVTPRDSLYILYFF
jgi:hypothetical protein